MPRANPVLAKVLWAEHHLGLLDKEVRTYLDVCERIGQMPIRTQIDTDRNIVRLEFNPLPEPDWRISLIIGDCVHNARSCLDHLWKRMSRQGNFPMFGMLEGEKGWRMRRSSILASIPTGAHAIIDALQPCSFAERAQSHPLAILNKLAKIDKHESLHLTKPRSIETRFTFRTKAGDVVYSVVQPVVFHEHAELILHNVPASRFEPQMYVHLQGTLFVTFQEAGPWEMKPVQEVLGRCIDFLKRSVFAPLIQFTR